MFTRRRGEKVPPMNVAFGDVMKFPRKLTGARSSQNGRRRRKQHRTRNAGAQKRRSAGTMMTTTVELPVKDTGINPDEAQRIIQGDLESTEDQVLEVIRTLIGKEEATRKLLETIPSWITQKALYK